MARRLLRFFLTSGLLVAVGLLVRRSLQLRAEATNVVPSPDQWTPIRETLSEPRPDTVRATETLPAAETPAAAAPEPPWLPPVDGACPPTHLIKAKMASHIYHLPGMANYARTKPDRCYAEVASAAADGFTAAKR